MARKTTITITDTLDDKQAEVTGLAKRVVTVHEALDNAASCETDADFRANLVAAYDEAQELIDEIRILTRCDACKRIHCVVGCPRRAGVLR